MADNNSINIITVPDKSLSDKIDQAVKDKKNKSGNVGVNDKGINEAKKKTVSFSKNVQDLVNVIESTIVSAVDSMLLGIKSADKVVEAIASVGVGFAKQVDTIGNTIDNIIALIQHSGETLGTNAGKVDVNQYRKVLIVVFDCYNSIIDVVLDNLASTIVRGKMLANTIDKLTEPDSNPFELLNTTVKYVVTSVQDISELLGDSVNTRKIMKNLAKVFGSYDSITMLVQTGLISLKKKAATLIKSLQSPEDNTIMQVNNAVRQVIDLSFEMSGGDSFKGLLGVVKAKVTIGAAMGVYDKVVKRVIKTIARINENQQSIDSAKINMINLMPIIDQITNIANQLEDLSKKSDGITAGLLVLKTLTNHTLILRKLSLLAAIRRFALFNPIWLKLAEININSISKILDKIKALADDLRFIGENRKYIKRGIKLIKKMTKPGGKYSITDCVERISSIKSKTFFSAMFNLIQIKLMLGVMKGIAEDLTYMGENGKTITAGLKSVNMITSGKGETLFKGAVPSIVQSLRYIPTDVKDLFMKNVSLVLIRQATKTLRKITDILSSIGENFFEALAGLKVVEIIVGGLDIRKKHKVNSLLESIQRINEYKEVNMLFVNIRLRMIRRAAKLLFEIANVISQIGVIYKVRDAKRALKILDLIVSGDGKKIKSLLEIAKKLNDDANTFDVKSLLKSVFNLIIVLLELEVLVHALRFMGSKSTYKNVKRSVKTLRLMQEDCLPTVTIIAAYIGSQGDLYKNVLKGIFYLALDMWCLAAAMVPLAVLKIVSKGAAKTAKRINQAVEGVITVLNNVMANKQVIYDSVEPLIILASIIIGMSKLFEVFTLKVTLHALLAIITLPLQFLAIKEVVWVIQAIQKSAAKFNFVEAEVNVGKIAAITKSINELFNNYSSISVIKNVLFAMLVLPLQLAAMLGIMGMMILMNKLIDKTGGKAKLATTEVLLDGLALSLVAIAASLMKVSEAGEQLKFKNILIVVGSMVMMVGLFTLMGLLTIPLALACVAMGVMIFLSACLILCAANLVLLSLIPVQSLEKAKEVARAVIGTVFEIVDMIFDETLKRDELPEGAGPFKKFIHVIKGLVGGLVTLLLSVFVLAAAVFDVGIILLLYGLLSIIGALPRLNTDAIIKVVNDVITCVFAVLDAILNAQHTGSWKEEQSKRGLIGALLQFISPTLTSMIDMILSSILLVSAVIAVGMIYFLRQILGTIQNMEPLDRGKIAAVINDVVDACYQVIKACYGDGTEADELNNNKDRGVLGQAIAWLLPKNMVAMLDAISNIAFIGMSYLCVWMIKNLAEYLVRISKLESLDGVRESAQRVMNVATVVIDAVNQRMDIKQVEEAAVKASAMNKVNHIVSGLVDMYLGIYKDFNRFKKYDTDGNVIETFDATVVDKAMGEINKVIGKVVTIIETLNNNKKLASSAKKVKGIATKMNSCINVIKDLTISIAGKFDSIDTNALNKANVATDVLTKFFNVLEALTGKLGSIIGSKFSVAALQKLDLTPVIEVIGNVAEKVTERLGEVDVVKLNNANLNLDKLKSLIEKIKDLSSVFTKENLKAFKPLAMIGLARGITKIISALCSKNIPDVDGLSSLEEKLLKITDITQLLVYEIAPNPKSVNKSSRSLNVISRTINKILKVFNIKPKRIKQINEAALGMKNVAVKIKEYVNEIPDVDKNTVNCVSDLIYPLYVKPKIVRKTLRSIKKMNELIPELKHLVKQLNKLGKMSDKKLTETKKNLDNVSELIQAVNKVLNESNNLEAANIGGTEKIMTNYSKFIDKINSADAKKLKISRDMFHEMAEFSRSISGNFEGLAQSLNDKIMPTLDSIKDFLSELPEQIEQASTKAQKAISEINDSVGGGHQETEADIVKRLTADGKMSEVDAKKQAQNQLKEQTNKKKGSVVNNIQELADLLRGNGGEYIQAKVKHVTNLE